MAATGSAIAAWAGSTAGITTIASAAVSAYGISQQQSNARDARNAARSSADLQRQARAQQQAQNAQQQAEARRAQVREERVRRARIIQSAENSGVSESSGALGAQGALSTNLSSNLGQQAGAALSGEKQSNLLQGAADFNYSSQDKMAKSNLYGRVGQMGFNIFQKSIGF